MNYEWILTDDDSFQHVKCISDDTYHLIEMGLINPETDEYEVYTDVICITDYLNELDEILSEFGYGDGACENESNQIIAECIFEHNGIFQASQLIAGSEGECEKFILDFIKNS